MPAPSTTALAAQATAFKSLHTPGTPIILANAYDATSARVIGSLPGCRALASASYALAKSIGIADEQLTLEQNLALLAPIAAVAHDLGLPLTVDIQDGYGDRLDEVVTRVITELGAVGANLEDSFNDEDGGGIMEETVAVSRVVRAAEIARELGVGDFVLNVRSDTFFKGGELEESIRLGKRYLGAGATTVYIIWPAGQEILEVDVRHVVDELGGRVNIQPRKASQMQSKALATADLARLGVARVSVGPQLYFAATAALTDAANEVLGGM